MRRVSSIRNRANVIRYETALMKVGAAGAMTGDRWIKVAVGALEKSAAAAMLLPRPGSAPVHRYRWHFLVIAMTGVMEVFG